MLNPQHRQEDTDSTLHKIHLANIQTSFSSDLMSLLQVRKLHQTRDLFARESEKVLMENFYIELFANLLNINNSYD